MIGTARAMPDPTQKLVEDASRGDSLALDRLLEHHLPGLRAYVRLRSDRLLRAKESESDLVQSVCREVLEHMERYQYQSEAGFRQWLYRTAERKIIDRFRYYNAEKRSAAREVNGEDLRMEDSRLLEAYGILVTPSRDAMAREELRRVEAAFERLPADYREIIVLARIVGLPHAEIARQLGRTPSSVRNALYRGLALLSDHLAKEGA
jgi:RNA polymerase sigma-70 factor (ECF subfamily)